MAARKKEPKTPDAGSTAVSPDGGARTIYRALADCRVGQLRREGEVFSWPAFAECPEHLEEVDESALPENGPEDTHDAHQGATLADLGLGPAKSVAEVTSSDMITRG